MKGRVRGGKTKKERRGWGGGRRGRGRGEERSGCMVVKREVEKESSR